MSIAIPATASSPSSDVTASDATHASTKAAATKQRANAKNQLNESIMQASLDVSISSQNDSLSLLFKTAIDGINKELQPTLGDNAIQAAASQDNTPEATAGRIVSLSTGFFEAFKKNHVGEDSAGVLQLFMDSLNSGFDKGFKEATDILTGLKVFNGDIASNANKTRDLVKQGYADFAAAQQALISGTSSGAPASQAGSPAAASNAGAAANAGNNVSSSPAATGSAASGDSAPTGPLWKN